MIRYLLDELTTYEKSHDNALCPIPDEVDQSFNGDHVLTQPPKASELRECVDHMNRQYEELKEQNLQLSKQLMAAISLLTSGIHISGPSPSSIPQTSASTSTSQTLLTPTPPPPHAPIQVPTSTPQIPPSQPLTWSAFYSPNNSNGHGTLGPSIPEAKIPNLPRGSSGWKEAINQWEKADPDTGFSLKDWPKSWYTGEMKRFNASKRTVRRRIAEEYDR